MRWLRKLFSVGVVIGVAALMSIPFKRVPPRETNKSAGRGQWEFVEPRLQLEQILKPTAGGSAEAAISVSDDGQRPAASSGLTPNSTPTRVQRDGASNDAASASAPVTDSSANESTIRGSTGRTRSAARPRRAWRGRTPRCARIPRGSWATATSFFRQARATSRARCPTE